ncbi:hypothetical protein QWM81_28725 [Streptomyces ficellus]|uniref:Uncharacterized protein n=1 Tax=Streptomyces ficellus TaxID=1977088 RepID=A0ABT7ZEL2_9ACTN|nr:hypothetical protein [Streptomyces ficellus]MDN3297951.1 hypothetical protein [Streptomyces ficellus]
MTSDIPLPEFPALAELAAQGGGATGHPVLDAVLAGVRERAGETVVAYYDDAP